MGPENTIYAENSSSWDTRSLQLSIEGIEAVLLSLKKKPLIRYQKNSPMCKKLAAELHVRKMMIKKYPVFFFFIFYF